MRLVSVAVRLTKTIVRPSAEKDGELPVIVATLPSGIDSTLNVAGVAGPPVPRRARPLRHRPRLCRRGQLRAHAS